MSKNERIEHRKDSRLRTYKTPDKEIENEQVGVIMRTTNYQMFDAGVSGNRDLNESNLIKLLSSHGKKQVKSIPAVVREKEGLEKGSFKSLEIMDGQHRFFICKVLGIPFIYTIDNDFLREDISLVNTANKQWDVKDHLNEKVDIGNNNYILYFEVVGEYPQMENYVFLQLLNKRPGAKQLSYQDFKEGKMTMTEEDKEDMLGKLSKLVKFEKFKKWGSRPMMLALIRLLYVEGFDSWRLYNRMDITDFKHKFGDGNDALEKLIQIYNKGLSKNTLEYTSSGKKITNIFFANDKVVKKNTKKEVEKVSVEEEEEVLV